MKRSAYMLFYIQCIGKFDLTSLERLKAFQETNAKQRKTQTKHNLIDGILNDRNAVMFSLLAMNQLINANLSFLIRTYLLYLPKIPGSNI